MTAIEMQIKFLQKLQNFITLDLDIRTIDIEYFLNRGQELWVDFVYDKFKGEEAFYTRLSSVLVPHTLSSPAVGTGIHGGTLWNIPSDARYVIDESINTHSIPVKPVDNTYYNLNKNNPFKKPSPKIISRMINSNKVYELIGYTGLTISNYSFVYVKNPSEISILKDTASQISSDWHNEIIDKAVEFAMEVYQISGSLRTQK